MSNQNETKLGTLPTCSNERRDAVHVACVAVVAAQYLTRGAMVELCDGKAILSHRATAAIGIVDPFLTSHVQAGERFWLCLMPGTVSRLRHEWDHPAFAASAAPTPAPEPVNEHKEWITSFHPGEMECRDC